jgi:hypothetical protein
LRDSRSAADLATKKKISKINFLNRNLTLKISFRRHVGRQKNF